MNTIQHPFNFLFFKPETIVLGGLLSLPVLVSLWSSFYFYSNSHMDELWICLTNLIFFVFLTLFPDFLFRFGNSYFILFMNRAVKELVCLDPPELTFSYFQIFIRELSFYVFEGSFWILLFFNFFSLLYEMIKAFCYNEIADHLHTKKTNLIQQLPALEYCDYLKQTNAKTGAKDIDCPICLESFLPNDFINSMAKCGHIFHQECIRKWLLCRTTCPYCRSEIFTPEEEEIDPNERNFSDIRYLGLGFLIPFTLHRSFGSFSVL